MNTPYRIRQRVPKALVPILHRQEIKKTFNTQAEVDTFRILLDECTAIVTSNLPLEITAPLCLDKGLKQYAKQPKTTAPKEHNLEEIVALYMSHSKGRVTKREYDNRVNFFTKLLPALFAYHKLNVNSLQPSDMQTLSNAILKLPNRKYYEYRALPTEELVALDVPIDRRQKVDSCNKQIKRIRGLALYGESTGLYNIPTKIATHKEAHQDKGHREPFTEDEYNKLTDILPNKARLLLDIIYYSGLRPSEIHKAKITTIDGVVCYDLKDSKEPLKTLSSYRYVPIHSNLLPHIEEIQKLTYTTIRSLSRKVKVGNKTLYSARHSFVTNLINLGVPSERVSELVGHSHKTMTMQVYFQGYSISQLKDDVELL